MNVSNDGKKGGDVVLYSWLSCLQEELNLVIEELLECERKITNNKDRYAVVIIMCSIFVFSVSDENFPHDKYFLIYGVL